MFSRSSDKVSFSNGAALSVEVIIAVRSPSETLFIISFERNEKQVFVGPSGTQVFSIFFLILKVMEYFGKMMVSM